LSSLRDPAKAIVYINQVEEHKIGTRWGYKPGSFNDEVNSMLEYCKTESMTTKEEASLAVK